MTKVVATWPHNGTFSSELHQRNDDNLELADAELDGVTTMGSIVRSRSRAVGEGGG